MVWNPKYILLILFSTATAYLGGRLLDSKYVKEKQILRKSVLVICLICNIGLLIIFKYSKFITENINELFNAFHIPQIQIPMNFMMTIGISFYTFQVIGYTIDVYRANIDAEKNFWKFSLLVSFFPKLLSGPIEDSKSFLKQINNIENLRLWDYRRITDGCILIIWGIFIKMVIADRIAILVDTVFDSFRMYYSVELCVAAIAYSIQIYCDFMSYSTVALGSARVLGFEITDNFDTPYFSMSVKEFWRRWHISLSVWLRNYIYIPLGGNRCSKIRKHANLMITFLISGIWHGANWTFIVWGGLHGVYQIAGECLRPLSMRLTKHMKKDCFSFKFGKMIITFSLTTIAWIFFRVPKVTDGLYFIKRLLSKVNLWALSDGTLYTLGLDRCEINILLISLIILFIVELHRFLKNERLDEVLDRQNTWFKWMTVFTIIFAIIIFGKYGINFDSNQFIYFQF